MSKPKKSKFKVLTRLGETNLKLSRSAFLRQDDLLVTGSNNIMYLDKIVPSTDNRYDWFTSKFNLKTMRIIKKDIAYSEGW